MKRIVAIGAAAAIGSLLFVAPAEAAPTKHNKPTVEVTHDDFTIPFAAGEACAFPVTFHGVGTSTVITRKRTIKTFISDATATITNTTTGKTVKRNANTIFVDHLRKDGSAKSTSKGNSFFWGEDLTSKASPLRADSCWSRARRSSPLRTSTTRTATSTSPGSRAGSSTSAPSSTDERLISRTAWRLAPDGAGRDRRRSKEERAVAPHPARRPTAIAHTAGVGTVCQPVYPASVE